MWNCPTDKAAAAGGQSAKKGASKSSLKEAEMSKKLKKEGSKEEAEELDMLGQPSLFTPNRSGKERNSFSDNFCTKGWGLLYKQANMYFLGNFNSG